MPSAPPRDWRDRRRPTATLKSPGPGGVSLVDHPWDGRAPGRPSLLWPGRFHAAVGRWEWWLLAAAFVLAAAVRWTILDAHPYTAEAAHYAMSLHLWNGIDNIGSLFPDVKPDDFSWFFWQRPLLCLLYWPAAQFGFDSYRAAHILVAASVPPLAALLLRRLAVAPAYAYAAALVLAVHPVLVPWGVLVLPDTTVAVFTLGAILMAHAGRPFATAALLVAGAWVKEVAVVTTAALFLLALWREADGSRATLWPLRLGPFATVLVPAGLLSVAPLALSFLHPQAAVPGFRLGGDTAQSVERLFLLVWLAPLPFLGLLLPAIRRFCLVALAWPAFFLGFHLVTGKAIEVWYNVVPATLILCAAAAALSLTPRQGPSVRRWAPLATTLAVGLLLAVQVVASAGLPVNRVVATPLSHTGQWSLSEALAYEHARDDDLFTVLAAVPADHDGVWTALNMDYSLVMHPLATTAGFVQKDYTPEWNMTDDALRWWADAVETRADATFVVDGGDSLSRALPEAYAECATTAGMYTVIVPDQCQDFADRLIEAWHRHHDR